MGRNIAAHTGCSGVSYPGYVSINEDERGVTVTVRADPTLAEGLPTREGVSASTTMSKDEWEAMRKRITAPEN